MEVPSISGRHYRASFVAREHVVVVSFEPGDNYLLVLVYCVKHGKLSDVDDIASTPRLSDLNARYMGEVNGKERAMVDTAFEGIVAEDREERELVRSAKELCLVLPKYLADQSP